MSTLTPETNAKLIRLSMQPVWADAQAQFHDMCELARKLERERDEARRELENIKSHLEVYGSKTDRSLHMDVLHSLGERSQLRKVCDALARCLRSQVLESCDYNSLPHVIAAKKETKS